MYEVCKSKDPSCSVNDRKVIIDIFAKQPMVTFIDHCIFSIFFQRSSGFPPGMVDKMGYWTIDAHGEFVVIDHTPAFTIHSRESSYEVDDETYDQPITRSSSSIDKLYSKVGMSCMC